MLTNLQKELKFLDKLTKKRWKHVSVFKAKRLLLLNKFQCINCKNIFNLIDLFKTKKMPNKKRNLYCSSCRKSHKQKHYQKYKEIIKEKRRLNYIPGQYTKDKVKYFKRANEYRKNKKKTNSEFKLTETLRCRLWYALKSKKWSKTYTFNQYIGCSQEELKYHLQKQFKEGMTLETHGKWHIDHIIPLSSAKSEEEMYKLCHYTNLQPLWAKDNQKKGGKYLPLE